MHRITELFIAKPPHHWREGDKTGTDSEGQKRLKFKHWKWQLSETTFRQFPSDFPRIGGSAQQRRLSPHGPALGYFSHARREIRRLAKVSFRHPLLASLAAIRASIWRHRKPSPGRPAGVCTTELQGRGRG